MKANAHSIHVKRDGGGIREAEVNKTVSAKSK